MANNHINSDDTQSTRSLPRKDSRRGLAATGWLIAVLALVSLNPRVWADDAAVNLPAGVKAVWDVHPAYHETTPTRERICLNGLWRWQPADAHADQVPAANWGFFKVPGCWPGVTDYLQKDSQTLYAHPSWKDVKPGGITAAWYERELTIPREWAGRRIALYVEYLNSYAMVFVDGVKAGEIHFPAGEVDLTGRLRSGHGPSLVFAGGRPPAERRDAVLHRQRVGAPSPGNGRATGIVRRCLSGQYAARAKHHGHKRGHLRAQTRTHHPRRRQRAGSGGTTSSTLAS